MLGANLQKRDKETSAMFKLISMRFSAPNAMAHTEASACDNTERAGVAALSGASLSGRDTL